MPAQTQRAGRNGESYAPIQGTVHSFGTLAVIAMNRFKLFLVAFGIAYTTIAALCLLTGNPFIFYPIDYGLGGYFRLSLLVSVLCVGLVYVNLPMLNWIKRISKLKVNEVMYFISVGLITLQIVTMIIGYIESSRTRGVDSDPFYYYTCVSNSCLYVIAGNITVIVAAYLFAKTEMKKLQLTTGDTR